MPIAPTLVIGLGGTGSQIIEKVYAKVRETSASQSERIAFVAFDTDINDLADLKRRSPRVKTVQTSTRATVGEYLNVNRHARDMWFPVNEMLNRKTLTEGAAQVRAISRLAFDTTLKGGRLEPLHQAIDELFRIDKDQEEQALRVTITSSLAGGTGSGLILPVAMYLGAYLRAKYPKARAITRGFFIQPDVFYTVISAVEEQRNLQVNAYAAVRELDAFLMKGDKTLDDQYKALKFTFPQASGDGVEEVRAMPYDFCFLFDATNSTGAGLDSFASYKDHAATCIYTQSIGPMSKRHNSREDNVLREVIKNDGRNRYAGAGASRLVYPWKHLRDYVALRWADQALSTQWLSFDDQIKERREALAAQQESGFAVKDLDRGFEYIQFVESAESRKEPFAKAIVAQCTVWDEDRLNKKGNRWQEYVTALKEYVLKEADNKSDQALRQNAAITVAALSSSADAGNYVAAYYDLKRFHDLTERRTEEFAGIVGYSLFRAEQKSITKDGHAHQLESYLREKSSGKFVHPVAARYFLYHTLRMLQAEKQLADSDLEKTKAYFAGFARSFFINRDPDQAGDPEVWLEERKPSLKEKMRDKPGPKLQTMIQLAQTYIRKVDDLRDEYIWVQVLEEAIKYVTGICSAFETLFDQLESNLVELESDVDQHLTRYDLLKGSTTRYVLANSESLNFMYRSMSYTDGRISLDSDLSEDIYVQVRNYHMLRDEKDAYFFRNLYEERMLGYFKDQVLERYGPQIQFDIIEALEREYRALSHDFQDENVPHYVAAEIGKAKRLAAPFIEHPIGEERHPIVSCAYNPSISGKADPKRESLVEEHLGNYGGQRDEDISPQEILFYNAIYGIRARDLSKYAPEEKDTTATRPAGAYFAAYYHLVSQIKPVVTETRVITPHIDRRWHTIVALPDLDEGNEAKQFYAIHTAVFGGIALRVINLNRLHGKVMVYQYKPWNDVDQNLSTSNGTPCDRFYEVLDAVAINPVAAHEITQAVNRRIENYREDQPAPSFKDSPLAEALNAPLGIPLEELPMVIPGMVGRTITLFDFPTFYAISAPNKELSDSSLRRFTVDILRYVAEQIELVEEPSQVDPILEELLRRSFYQFQDNWQAYRDAAGDAFGVRVRAIMRGLYQYLDERHIRDLAQDVEAFENSLRLNWGSEMESDEPEPGLRV